MGVHECWVRIDLESLLRFRQASVGPEIGALLQPTVDAEQVGF